MGEFVRSYMVWEGKHAKMQNRAREHVNTGDVLVLKSYLRIPKRLLSSICKHRHLKVSSKSDVLNLCFLVTAIKVSAFCGVFLLDYKMDYHLMVKGI